MIAEPYSMWLILLGLAFTFYTCPRYIHGMFVGRVKPNKVTWLIWGIAPLIGGAAMLSNGFSWSVVPVLSSGAWPLVIFLCALFAPKAYWRTTNFDYYCGFLSLAAMVLWIYTDIPLVAVVLTVVADFLAGIPTLKKAWFYPETESFWPFLSGVYANGVGLLTLTQLTWLSALFPAYLFCFSALMVWLCVRGK